MLPGVMMALWWCTEVKGAGFVFVLNQMIYNRNSHFKQTVTDAIFYDFVDMEVPDVHGLSDLKCVA